MTRIAVVGGTGVVGRHVVERLHRDGHDPIVMTRSHGVDIQRGSGLDAALSGVTTVIDVANTTTMSKSSAVDFFGTASNNLLRAEARAGVCHHITLSIVGIDDVDFGYYVGKRAQEAAVKAADIPWTILRATQFHEFPAQLADRMKGPVLPVPRMRSQPVSAREVADALADLAAGPAASATRTIAGPQVHEMPDLVRRLLRVDGSHRLVVPIRLGGKTGRQMASGALLDPDPDVRGTQTFEQWLEERRAALPG